jgi:hypothetical protein
VEGELFAYERRDDAKRAEVKAELTAAAQRLKLGYRAGALTTPDADGESAREILARLREHLPLSS